MTDDTFRSLDSPQLKETVAVHGEQIKSINVTIQNFSEVMDRQTESIQAVSEAVVRLASMQELLQDLYSESKETRKDINELNRSVDVLKEKAKAVPKLEEEVETLRGNLDKVKTRQTQNNVVISSITAFITMIATGAVTYFFKIFGNGG